MRLAALGAATAVVLSDAEIHENFTDRNERGTSYALARDVEPLGRSKLILPALAATYALGFVVKKGSLENETFQIAAGYFAADAVTAGLKAFVGRNRPASGRGAFRFRPSFRAKTDWDSFPSGHTTHAFAIAAGIAAETDNRLVRSISYSAASAVALTRLRMGAHWSSDVAAGALIGACASTAVISRLRSSPNNASVAGPEMFLAPHKLGLVLRFR